jgi:hypothetical protein
MRSTLHWKSSDRRSDARSNRFLQRGLTMSIGSIFFVIAAVVLFLGGIGSTIIPNSVIWGLFCMTLGLLLTGYGFNFRRNN